MEVYKKTEYISLDARYPSTNELLWYSLQISIKYSQYQFAEEVYFGVYFY